MRNGALVLTACEQSLNPPILSARNAIDDQHVANYHFTVSASSGELELLWYTVLNLAVNRSLLIDTFFLVCVICRSHGGKLENYHQY